MPTKNQQNESVATLCREEAEEWRKLAFINVELSAAANHFKKAACQIENLTSEEPANVESALSPINIDRVLRLLGERVEVRRRLVQLAARLRNATHRVS